MTLKVLCGPVVHDRTLEVRNEWVGTPRKPHPRASKLFPPAISPAVPHPLCPWTAGWASAVHASLSGWHMPLQATLRVLEPSLPLVSPSGLPLTHWDPGRGPELGTDFPVFCLESLRGTFSSIGAWLCGSHLLRGIALLLVHRL